MARDAVCIGEALIDFVPTEPGVSLADALSFRKAAGGAPANVAVGLARLGVSTSFIGVVGDDPFGEHLVKTLAAAGVGVEAVQRTSDAPTSLAFVSPLPDGGGDFVFYRQPGADTLLSTGDVDRDLIAGARFVHFGSIGLADEPSRSATLHAVDCARGSDCRTSCDVNLRLRLWPGARCGKGGAPARAAACERRQALGGRAGVRRRHPGSPAIGLKALWHDELELAVVTHGEKGCTWVTRETSRHVEAFDVDQVDPTGAGDGFTAGLLAEHHRRSGLHRGRDAALHRLPFRQRRRCVDGVGLGGNSGAAGTGRRRAADERALTARRNPAAPVRGLSPSAGDGATGIPTTDSGTYAR